MNLPKNYIENTYKLVKEFSRLNLAEKCVITGGICANSYFMPEFRRYSDDIDILLSEENVPTEFKGPYIHESGAKYYFKNLERSLFLYLIIENVNLEKYQTQEIGTFNEYFSERGSKLIGKKLEKEEILKKKMEWISLHFRGAEAIRDAYDIPLLARDIEKELIKECIEELGESCTKLCSWIITMKKFKKFIQRKTEYLIASGTFPEKTYSFSLEKLYTLCESYSPEEMVRSSVIFALSRREVKEILKRAGIQSDKMNDLNKILYERLKYTDSTKIEKFTKNILEYGKEGVLEVLNEIFPKIS